jgi:hypothetical protein
MQSLCGSRLIDELGLRGEDGPDNDVPEAFEEHYSTGHGGRKEAKVKWQSSRQRGFPQQRGDGEQLITNMGANWVCVSGVHQR